MKADTNICFDFLFVKTSKNNFVKVNSFQESKNLQ